MQSRLPGWLVLFGMMLSLLAAGSWLGVTSARGLYTAYRSQFWDSTPCRVLSSEVRQTTGRVANHAWYVSATCAYQSGGQLRTINCSPHSSGSKELADSQFRSLQVNSEHVCYVNPQNLAEAIYAENRSFLLPLFFLIVGTLFIALGWSGAVFLIRNGTS
jgi:Protein of unknown function (DUF3592)